MTGLLPETHGVVTAQDVVSPGLPLLAERFEDAGWDTASFVQMIFASDRHGLQRGFLRFEYPGMGEAKYPEFREDLRQWISSRGERPSLLYLHFRRPHSPYDPPADALAPFSEGPLADGSRDQALRFISNEEAPELTALDRARLVQLYRGSLRAIDAEIGALLPLLRLDTDTLLVVTSDHGEGLGEHGDVGHGSGLWLEHVHVPLIVAGPGLAPHVVSEPVCTVDLAPTLLALSGLPPLVGGEGVPLVPLLLGGGAGTPGGAPRAAPITIAARRYPGKTPAAAVVEGRWFLRREAGGTTQLYDLQADPQQERDVASEHGDVTGRLLPSLERLQAWEPRPGGARGAEPALSPEDEQELRALGYVR
jgi:arylsulfatase A-like enzyme